MRTLDFAAQRDRPATLLSSRNFKPEMGEACIVTAAARHHHRVMIDITPMSEADRLSAASTFWRLAGDLAADILLDDVEVAWGNSTSASRESLQ